MASKLLLYMLLLGAGLFLGRKGFIGEKVYDSLDLIQMMCLMLLLFMMGINLGANKKIVESIAEIGLTGFTYGIFTVVFSIIFVNIYARFIYKKG
ncbi:MAG: LysO family transporter [Proteocatella sp.]